jgi:hypothetical protein
MRPDLAPPAARRRHGAVLLLLILLAGPMLAACAGARTPPNADAEQAPAATLRPFASEAEYLRFVERVQAEEEQAEREARRNLERARTMRAGTPPPPAAPPPPPGMAPTAAAAGAESITNVQHAGVDEGGIVKVHGDYLVILRRGRLFTVRVGGDELAPISAVDAFGPDIEPAGAWYDEILVAGDLVAVIGYSYARGGTEVGLFHLDGAGRLTHRDTYQIRSWDYYSSRNYASRLVDGKLVFYAPLPLRRGGREALESLPAMRRWSDREAGFRPTVSATRIYRPAGEPTHDAVQALHTVTVCDPETPRGEMTCASTSLVGPAGRVFYVSPAAVYVWTVQRPAWYRSRPLPEPRAILYRLPLDGGAPTALRVTGAPVDQLSFLESADGHLNVLVLSEGIGDGMWGAGRAAGNAALLRVPLAAFADGTRPVDPAHFRPLPWELGYGLQNRFVGDWLLLGEGGGGWWGEPGRAAPLMGVRWATGDTARLALPHAVERIEAMGSGAVIVGAAGGDLHFSGVRLGERLERAHRYVRADAAQGESRTHGFFYRPDGADEGLLGLPVRDPGRMRFGPQGHGSAVLFLRNTDFRLTELGALGASEPSRDDGCRASCVDWYGNARPIFLRGRVFALLGYELVEGAVREGRIRELRRASFAPAAGLRGGGE